MAEGPWTTLLLAIREALDEWDMGEPFDPDSSRGGDLMDALRGPVAAVDLIEAAKADVAPDLLAAAKVVAYEFLSGMEYPETQALRDAIAKAESGES